MSAQGYGIISAINIFTALSTDAITPIEQYLHAGFLSFAAFFALGAIITAIREGRR